MSTTLIASDLSRQPYSVLEKLPGEMVSAIAQFVSPRDILRLRLTSRKLHQEMDREMKWALKGVVLPFYLEFSRLSHLKWGGESRIGKHITTIEFLRPSISNFSGTEFYRDQFIPVAHEAFKGFEKLEAVSIMLWDPMDGPCHIMDDPNDIPWCFEAMSHMLHGLENDISFSAASRTYRCEVPRLGIRERTINEVIVRGVNQDFDVDEDGSMLSNTFAALWKGITSVLLSGSQYPSILRLSQTVLQDSDVDRLYSPDWAPDVLFLEDVRELCMPPSSDDDDVYEDDVDEDDVDEDDNHGLETRMHAFQALVSHPKHNLRELSLIRCTSEWIFASWIPFFEALKKHKHLENLRFEDIDCVRFDWDRDGNLDDGSRLPEIIKELGMEQALDKTIDAYRRTFPDNFMMPVFA